MDKYLNFENLKDLIVPDTKETQTFNALIIFMINTENKIIYINNKINGYNSLPEESKPIISKYFVACMMQMFGHAIADKENSHYTTDHLIDIKTKLCNTSQTNINKIIDYILLKLHDFAYGHKAIVALHDIKSSKLIDSFTIILKGYLSKGHIDNEDILFANTLYKNDWRFELTNLNDITIEVTD